MMSLALELQSRGHQAIIATSELYRQKIEGEGIGFHATRPDLPSLRETGELVRKVMDAKTGSEYLFKEMLMPSLRPCYDDLSAIAGDCDLLISHTPVPAAPLVAKSLGKKWLSAVLFPLGLWSVCDPPTTPAIPALLRTEGARKNLLLQRGIKRIARRVSNRWIAPVFDLQRELGLPRAHPFFEGQFSPYGTLVLFSRVLAPPQPDWPEKTTVCGYCLYDRLGEIPGGSSEFSGTQLHPDIQKFLAEGEKPLVFTLGSAAVYDGREFFEHSAQAARNLGKRAVLICGNQDNRPALRPEDKGIVEAFDYAPFGAILPNSLAIVHQGGAGTVGQVLSSGVPSLVVPYSHDQPDYAARLQRMGVARTITRHKYNAATATRELGELLAGPQYSQRAREVADIVRSENGPRRAVDEIEKVLAS